MTIENWRLKIVTSIARPRVSRPRSKTTAYSAPTARPVLILGSLDGIETGIRQLIREEPLETEEVEVNGEKLLLPTKAEMLRIKAVLILKRNATRDYLDFVALSDLIGDGETFKHRDTEI